jgi:hypothetical protein
MNRGPVGPLFLIFSGFSFDKKCVVMFFFDVFICCLFDREK